ncbi:MAG: transporter substrate-binding domain-containing protein [Oscillospiraceae bacterium]|nr:transporter substrate-binding domain-containing protein [Oscillospiraceae bacterium]
MKHIRLISTTISLIMSMSLLTGCDSIPKNKVFSINDLSGKTIGVQFGTVGDAYASDIADATVERYNKGADAVMELKQGKLDAVLIDVEPAKVFVQNNKDLKILDETFAVEEYAIAIKKGNTELTDKINSALSALSSDGTLDLIKSNWIGDDAGKSPYVSPEGLERKNGTLTMATNAEFPPYESMMGEDIIGLDVDMMRAVCDRLDMQLNIVNMEFDSILPSVDSGAVDVGVAGMTITADRQQIVDFSDSYTTATQVIIVRNE